MSLRITELKFNNFRNYENFELFPSEKLTIIVGDNAVGKTNIIEGIQLLTMMDSFRKPQWEELVRWGSLSASLSLRAEDEVRSVDIKMNIKEGKKNFTLNGKKKSVSTIRGVLPSVIFTPDDLRMIKDSAEKRRNAIDNVGIQLSSSYYSIKNDYEKIVRQRNVLLKEQSVVSKDLFLSWNESLTSIGSIFFGHRFRLFERMREKVIQLYKELSPSENLEILYKASWNKYLENSAGLDKEMSVCNQMKVALDNSHSDELKRGITLVGPHRDEIVFLIDEKDCRQYGSQGQQRTLVLAWKLAEVEVIKEINNQPPVLLLDDVMSELDEFRRNALTEFVGNKIQTVITTTNLGYFNDDFLSSAKVVKLPWL